MPQTALKAIMFADVVGYTAMMQRDRVAAMTAVKGLISDETPAFRLPLIPVPQSWSSIRFLSLFQAVRPADW